MKITHEFCPGDRYTYDFGLCSFENGWAQIDTAQDASYFGTWANPTRLMIFSYCEGDTTLKEAASRLCCANRLTAELSLLADRPIPRAS